MNAADAQLATMPEEKKQALQAAAKLLGTENAERIVMFIYQSGYMDGLLDMAQAQARRVDAAMRKIL